MRKPYRLAEARAGAWMIAGGWTRARIPALSASAQELALTLILKESDVQGLLTIVRSMSFTDTQNLAGGDQAHARAA